MIYNSDINKCDECDGLCNHFWNEEVEARVYICMSCDPYQGKYVGPDGEVWSIELT